MLDVMGVYNESFSMWDYENFDFGALIESLEGQGASKRVESSVLPVTSTTNRVNIKKSYLIHFLMKQVHSCALIETLNVQFSETLTSPKNSNWHERYSRNSKRNTSF